MAMVYLFGVWALLITISAWLSRMLRISGQDDPPGSE